MQIFSYFLFFVVICWVLFFIFLPIKNETPQELHVDITSSASIQTYLLIKVIITSVLSLIILITLI